LRRLPPSLWTGIEGKGLTVDFAGHFSNQAGDAAFQRFREEVADRILETGGEGLPPARRQLVGHADIAVNPTITIG
jgi:hypothetical protein